MGDGDDVDILIPGREEEEELATRLRATEIKSILCKVGITQTVLGVALTIGGIIISASWPNWGVDRLAEGMWCGFFVLMSGPLSISARFHLHISLVITCLVMNSLCCLLLTSGIVLAGMSSMMNALVGYGSMEFSIGFTVLNMMLTACFVMSVYLLIVYGKILRQKKSGWCDWHNQRQQHNYGMVYVPSAMHSSANPS